MLKRLNEIRKTEGGFTLVEMLVVVSILGVLASVAVVAIGGTMKESKAAACKSEVATFQTAADSYLAKTGTEADSLAVLVPAYVRTDPGRTEAADGYTLAVADGVAASTPSCDDLTD